MGENGIFFDDRQSATKVDIIYATGYTTNK
jgi:hypothetical protein